MTDKFFVLAGEVMRAASSIFVDTYEEAELLAMELSRSLPDVQVGIVKVVGVVETKSPEAQHETYSERRSGN